MESMSHFYATVTLIFFRLLPIWIVAPIAMFRRIPMLVRIVLTVSIAIILSVGYHNTPSHVPANITWLSLGSEFLLGLVLAFGFHVAQGSVQTMGHIIDQQIGFAAATVFDPGSEQTQSLMSELLTLMVLIAFLALDVHHLLLNGIASTINVIPPGHTFSINSSALFGLVGLQFALGFALACPVILTLWLIDVVLAMSSRSLPQANVYFTAMPIKICIGLLLIVWLSNNILPQLARMFEAIFDSWILIFQE